MVPAGLAALADSAPAAAKARTARADRDLVDKGPAAAVMAATTVTVTAEEVIGAGAAADLDRVVDSGQVAVVLVEADLAAAVQEVVDRADSALVAALRSKVKEVRVVKQRIFPRERRRGLTLLELILALALSVLVLMAIGMAIDVHYRMFDVRRTSIEETHVARAVLRSIADDLRTAVQYVPPDLSGLETVTGNTATAIASSAANAAEEITSGAGGGLPMGGGNTGGSPPEDIPTGDQSGMPPTSPMGFGTPMPTGQGSQTPSGGTPMGGVQGFGSFGAPGTTSGGQPSGAPATGETEETSELGTPITIVGLYGSASSLQFDMSRLPRVDEYEALYSANSELGVIDIPSDIKTVTYFVCSEDTFEAAKNPGLMSGSPQPSISGRGRGLMRRELSQAVSSWAEANGNLQATYADAKLLADEVVGVQFRYYDGDAWLEDWNSDDLGGLPTAVEITVTIQPTYAMSEEALEKFAADEPPPEKAYSLIVHLPAAHAAAAAMPTVVDTAAGDSAVLEQEAMP